MTRTWRYLVLLGGILGVFGFFAPFFEVRAPDGTFEGASAYEIARGQPDVSHLMDKARALGMVSADEAERATRLLQQGMVAYRSVMLACFGPAALLALLGLAGFVRRHLGRVDGLLAIVCGLAVVVVYALAYQAPTPARTTGQLGLGLYLLTIGGLLGLLGGLGALIVPERKT